jgi:hypothetical protein
MENGEQSGSGRRSDWPVRLATGVGTVVEKPIEVEADPHARAPETKDRLAPPQASGSR